jgi:hypothetical protein
LEFFSATFFYPFPKSVKMQLTDLKWGDIMKNDEQDDLEKDEEEKKYLLDYIKMQNEALKRMFKNTLDKEKDE